MPAGSQCQKFYTYLRYETLTYRCWGCRGSDIVRLCPSNAAGHTRERTCGRSGLFEVSWLRQSNGRYQVLSRHSVRCIDPDIEVDRVAKPETDTRHRPPRLSVGRNQSQSKTAMLSIAPPSTMPVRSSRLAINRCLGHNACRTTSRGAQ